MKESYDYDTCGVLTIKKENSVYYLCVHPDDEWHEYTTFADLITRVTLVPEWCLENGEPNLFDLTKEEEIAIKRVRQLSLRISELERIVKPDEDLTF